MFFFSFLSFLGQCDPQSAAKSDVSLMTRHCDGDSNIDKDRNNIIFKHDSDVSLLPKRDNATAMRAPAASIPVSAGVQNSAWQGAGRAGICRVDSRKEKL